MDGVAFGYWQNLSDEKNHDLSMLYNTENKRISGPLMLALIIDPICLVCWIALVLASIIYQNCVNKKDLCKNKCTCGSVKKRGIYHCKVCTPDQPDKKCKHCATCDRCCYDYIPILSLTILCPIFCVIAHLPYIAIAYLDDGSHANSMFIYYSILVYTLFGLLWLFFHWCENFDNDITNNCCCLM